MDLAACLAELDDAFDAHDALFSADHCVGNIESWDQDVLLSNAVLPETNPLLEINNDVDDLHKILGEWDSEANMQVDSDAFRGQDALSDFEMETTAPSSGSNDAPADVELTSNSPFSAALSTPDTCLSPIASPEPAFSMKSLAGIVISSGPGGHFETYEVIEASDADNLLEQFEANTSCDTFTTAEDAASQKSQIVQAVNSHFSGAEKGFPPGRVPKIVSSQRVRDSLPREIIERIRESSQKSKTIAIIEPVTKSGSSSSSPSACRFSDAAASLSRNRLLRSTSVSSPATTSTATSVPSPVNLDHDYCSSNRHRRTRTPSATQPRQQQPPLQVSVPASHAPISIRLAPTGPLSPNMGSVFRVSSACVGKSRELQVIRVEKRDSSNVVPAEKDPSVIQTVKFSPKERKASWSNDTKKDSGLESGEASDDTSGSNETDALFSKLPSYMTTVPGVEAPGAAAEREGDMHDRLPAYIKGVARLSTRSVAAVSAASAVAGARVSLLAKNNVVVVNTKPSETSTSRCDSTKSSPTKRSLRKRQRSTSTSSSTSSTSSSSRGRSTRKRTNSRRRRSSSSSSSSRSRSPKRSRGNFAPPKHGDERRNVYVGKIAEGTTRADLRRRFEAFGRIEEISLHFRDRGENYGFVKFSDRASAYRAIEHANDDPKQPRVDLCFGGRRNFCKEKYSDLDSANSGTRRRTRSSSSGAGLDFDSLLKQAAKSVRKKT